MLSKYLTKKNVIAVMVIYISIVFIQALRFKFTDSTETLHIFGTLNDWAFESFGIEGLFLPPGIFNAYVIGTSELIASLVMLAGLFTAKKFLIPIGAAMSFGIISGAIFFHLFTPLGVDVLGDGGLLFTSACGIWVVSAVLMWLTKHEVLGLLVKKST
ncbi:hypothetical protein [Glaciecola petra]|uniref:DoxX family protein n=1 Tax=Glaciecola petra TaxID=3075602 RepID=A0ABU2ZUM8_9ALTE|nr:hypothetical protein [Aestuariibacter sp. P117]MDT0596340.1 hypothetical protein [Aestuariibacter sp. P117]